MSTWPQAKTAENAVVIPTHCLFGSGGVVCVHVEGRLTDFVVHDAGAAIDEFASNGGQIANPVKLLRGLLQQRGFVITDEGFISSPHLRMEEIAPAVAQVANAAREASDYLLDRWRPVIRRDFKKVLRSLLETEFPHLKSHPMEIGASTRQHRFDFALDMKRGGVLLLDAVSHDQSAINASVIRNLDVRNGNLARVEQRIIYDDAQDWRAADLNLLSLGAKPVPFSRAQEVIERLAA
jgi:hypothetical protein